VLRRDLKLNTIEKHSVRQGAVSMARMCCGWQEADVDFLHFRWAALGCPKGSVLGAEE